jgi:pectate lyase
MRKIFTLFLVGTLLNLNFNPSFGQELTIQESTTGFCSVDGIIDTGVAGYTGAGFANTTSGIGVSITWSVFAANPGKYSLCYRYANGGTVMPLKGALIINDVVAIDTVSFKHTGTWTNWSFSDTLEVDLLAGPNSIRLKGHIVNGLPNLDYLRVIESGITPYSCLPTYRLTLDKNISAAGTVSYSPVQQYYDKGTNITLTATANPGYFFHSWNGEASASTASFTFPINANSNIIGMFYPDGTQMEDSVIGYATVLDDNGTPFMMIGGLLGDTVEAFNTNDLIQYLGDPLPHVVKLGKHVTGTYTTEIIIQSNKTLLGTSDSAHIEGMRVTLTGVQNVILKNVTFSKVERYDEIQISNSKNIWIDHCDFYTDRIQPLDFYDGLLDVKNASTHITVSWSKFHDHLKAILISSGDAQVADTAARLTFHHNYFYNCDARLPSLRFGKAHVFNNYFKDNVSAVNSRMNACIKVENNNFNNNGKAVRVDQSTSDGKVQLVNNIFNQSNYVSTPSCVLVVPYSYLNFLDNPVDLPFIIAGEIVSGISHNSTHPDGMNLSNYPNPAKGTTTLFFTLAKSENVSFSVHDLTGKAVLKTEEIISQSGQNEYPLDISSLKPGLYIYKMKTSLGIASKLLNVE